MTEALWLFVSWISNALLVMEDANLQACSDCEVHTGYKACNDGTIYQVLRGIRFLASQRPDYNIIFTGKALFLPVVV